MKFSKRIANAKKAKKKEEVVEKKPLGPAPWLKYFMLSLAVLLLITFLLFVFRLISAWTFWIVAGLIAIFVYWVFPKINKE